MKTDVQIKSDVTDELAWDPAVNETNIGVMVKDGVVTLAGHLDTFAEKHAVEHAVRRVEGVRGIALDLEVKLGTGKERSDSDIAEAASTALRLNSMLSGKALKVEVENGWVTLTGEVDWAFQFTSAQECIRHLAGVRGLINEITIKPRAKTENIAAQITAALKRHAAREASHIGIQVEGTTVTLNGTVDSLAEREAALGAAYCAKGVSRVVDHLRVGA